MNLVGFVVLYLTTAAVATAALPSKSSPLFLEVREDAVDNVTHANKTQISAVDDVIHARSAPLSVGGLSFTKPAQQTQVLAAAVENAARESPLANTRGAVSATLPKIHSAECHPTEATENMNDYHNGQATKDDCDWLCNNQGRETWCVHSEYSSEAGGTCSLYTCVPQSSQVRSSVKEVLAKLGSVASLLPVQACKDNELALRFWNIKTCSEHVAAGNCFMEKLEGICDATCGRCSEKEGEYAHDLDANKDGIITAQEFAAAPAEEVAKAGKNYDDVADEEPVAPLWMSEERLLNTYGQRKAKDMVDRGFISAKNSTGVRDTTQYALNWVSEETWRQMYDEVEIAKLFARGMTQSRPDPGNAERTQYLVEGSEWSPSNRGAWLRSSQ